MPSNALDEPGSDACGWEPLELERPSAAIPLPQGISAVVTLVVLLRLTGVAAGLARRGGGGLAESRGGNEHSQSQRGDERLHGYVSVDCAAAEAVRRLSQTRSGEGNVYSGLARTRREIDLSRYRQLRMA